MLLGTDAAILRTAQPGLYAVSHNAVSATHFHVQYQRRTSATAEDFRSVAPVGLHQIQTIPKEPATGMLIRFWWKWNIFRFVWSYRRRKSETALTERRVLCLERGPRYSLPLGEGESSWILVIAVTVDISFSTTSSSSDLRPGSA